ncbi:SHD1 domain-containing protein [Rhodopirellula sp. SWK7]|uniref:SHD1 domain-containing protein n=1 Tax=Rhodopirellula sp. SWK7 TaxID=595460 RepID=UPI0002BD8B27|nr:SHD1 domain-containing protein [Rhodopirellula sp. SWK7]EMI42092.1 hypothetical protein RRSWK_05384 [Rhodopirellula sp. SWK7]
MSGMHSQRKYIAHVIGLIASQCAVLLAVCTCKADEIDAARQWSTADGRFTVVASMIESPKPGSKSISLRRKDTGVTIQVPVAVLSQSDQDYLRERITHSSENASNADQAENEPPAVLANSSPPLETTKQLGDALIAGLSHRSASLFTKCFATVQDSKDLLLASELTGDVLDSELKGARAHFGELRREVPKMHSILRKSASATGIVFNVDSVVDVQATPHTRAGIESFDRIEITFKQPNDRLARLTMDDGIRSPRGWVISDKGVRLELLGTGTGIPEASTWDFSGGQRIAIPRTKLMINVPGKADPIVKSVQIETDEGTVIADVLVNHSSGVEFVVMVIDYKKARGGERSQASDEDRVTGGLAGGLSAVEGATIVEEYPAPMYVAGATAGQLMLMPSKSGLPEQHVMLFVNVRNSVLKSYQAAFDARLPVDVQAKIRKLLEGMMR